MHSYGNQQHCDHALSRPKPWAVPLPLSGSPASCPAKGEMMNRRLCSIACTLVVLLLRDASAYSSEAVRIGVLVSTSGSAELVGAHAWSGIRLAHKMKPTIDGREVRLIRVDCKSDPAEARVLPSGLSANACISCV